jgi:hypothetical protein
MILIREFVEVIYVLPEQRVQYKDHADKNIQAISWYSGKINKLMKKN